MPKILRVRRLHLKHVGRVHLRDGLLVGVRLPLADDLFAQRSEPSGLDLLHAGRVGRLAAAAVDHEEEVVGLPAEPAEAVLEVCGARRKDDAPVAELGLDAVGLGGDLLGGRVAGPLGSQHVQEPDRRVRVVEERRAEAGLHHPLHAPVADELFERGGPLEVTHRRACSRGRASRARRCRGGRRGRPSSR